MVFREKKVFALKTPELFLPELRSLELQFRDCHAENRKYTKNQSDSQAFVPTLDYV